MLKKSDWFYVWPLLTAVIFGGGFVLLLATAEKQYAAPEWVELDRATVGTVFVRPESVTAILGPGEVALDDGAGTRHNVHTQVVVGVLRINVRGTAEQARAALE